MWHIADPSLLAISVRWNNTAGSARGNSLPVVKQTATALAHCGLPSTWIVSRFSDPALAELAETRSQLDIGASIAQTHIGVECARSVVLEFLQSCLAGASRAGLQCGTIETASVEFPGHGDLLLKHGIHCVTSPMPGAPCHIRYGLWRIPVAITWPAAGGWLRGGAAALNRAAARVRYEHGLLHVQLDVDSLHGMTTAEIARVVQELADVAERRGLDAVSLQGAAQALSSPRRQCDGSRSILRAA